MDSATLIRRARVAAGLSQRELAARAKTSAAAVSLYENGQRIPKVDTLARLLAAADHRLVLDVFRPVAGDVERSGALLLEALERSDQEPLHRETELMAPIFRDLAG